MDGEFAISTKCGTVGMDQSEVDSIFLLCIVLRAQDNSTVSVTWWQAQNAIRLIPNQLPISPSYPQTSSLAASNNYLSLRLGELNSSDL